MKNKPSFEEKINRLEKIVETMEMSNVPLNNLITLFKEGVILSKECKSELNQLESTIQQVMRENDDGSLATEKVDIE